LTSVNFAPAIDEPLGSTIVPVSVARLSCAVAGEERIRRWAAIAITDDRS
jgi:hypothetical protein